MRRLSSHCKEVPMNTQRIKAQKNNIVLKQCDKMNAFINDPQQKIYTVPRRE